MGHLGRGLGARLSVLIINLVGCHFNLFFQNFFFGGRVCVWLFVR
jgi:hypothetical protein